MENLITFNKYLKKFKTNKVGPISFDIHKSKITAILGSSGSGKTVILNSLLGIIKKYKGKIIINNINRKSHSYHKSNRVIGYYTQMDFSLHDISAFNFLKDTGLVMGIKKSKINKKVKYWIGSILIFEIIGKKN